MPQASTVSILTSLEKDTSKLRTFQPSKLRKFYTSKLRKSVSFNDSLSGENNNVLVDRYRQQLEQQQEMLLSYLSGNRESLEDLASKHGNFHTSKLSTKHRRKVRSMPGKLTPKEAAEFLGVTYKTVDNYLRMRKLPFEWGQGPTGRARLISMEALEAFKNGEPIPSLEPSLESKQESIEPSIESIESIEPEVVTLETAQKEETTTYMVDVWAEVDRRISQAVQPYLERIEQLEAQIKMMEEHNNKVDVFITEWREREKEKQNRPWWKRLLGRY